MQEYVKITQTNQEMLGRMSHSESQVVPEPPVVFKESIKEEVPILTGYIDPPRVPKEEVEPIQKVQKRP